METSGDGVDAVVGAAAAILVTWINIPNKSNRSRNSNELRAASVVIVPPIVRWLQPYRHSNSGLRDTHRWMSSPPLSQSRGSTLQSCWQQTHCDHGTTLSTARCRVTELRIATGLNWSGLSGEVEAEGSPRVLPSPVLLSSAAFCTKGTKWTRDILYAFHHRNYRTLLELLPGDFILTRSCEVCFRWS
jgi:hypothetical protein